MSYSLAPTSPRIACAVTYGDNRAGSALPKTSPTCHFAQPTLLGRAQEPRVQAPAMRRVRQGMVSAVTAIPGLLVAKLHLDEAQRTRPRELLGYLPPVIFQGLRQRYSLQCRRGRTRRRAARAHQFGRRQKRRSTGRD